MPRVTKSNTAKAKHKKVLAYTKGHYGARSRLFKTAKQSKIQIFTVFFSETGKIERGFSEAYGFQELSADFKEFGSSLFTIDVLFIKQKYYFKQKDFV